MQRISNLILLATPAEVSLAQTHGLPMGHFAYRIGGGPHLFRANTPVPPQGGLMVLDEHQFDGHGTPDPFCQEVVRECRLRHFTGVVCLFQRTLPLLNRIVAQLAPLLERQNLLLYVSEPFGQVTQTSKVLISSAISGGTLRQRLGDAIAQYGAHRVALAVERTAQDFTLPSPSGQGLRLTPEQLQQRIQDLHPSIFFSSELCAHYFTYMAHENGVHFILFDDSNSIRKKLDLARSLGIEHALLPYGQVGEWLPDIL